MSAAAPHIGEGAVADYIPGLAAVDPKQFGIAVATAEGQVYGDGDVGVPFAIESISKVFALALVLSRKGTVIWDRVRREPSGMPFNDLIELELERGIPRNPYINPGAIVVADQLLFDTGDAVAALRDLFRAETGNRASMSTASLPNPNCAAVNAIAPSAISCPVSAICAIRWSWRWTTISGSARSTSPVPSWPRPDSWSPGTACVPTAAVCWNARMLAISPRS